MGEHAPRVWAAVLPPSCRCEWSRRDGEDWRLTERADDCPLHGPGQAFDYWRDIPPGEGRADG